MEVEKSRRSCFTQTSCLGEDLGEDSQLEYVSAQEEYEEDKNNSSEFSEQGQVAEVEDVPLAGDKVPAPIAAGGEEPGKSERPTQSVAVEPDIPFLPAGEKAQLCRHAEPSYFSGCEKPAVRTRGGSGAESTAGGAGAPLPAPETLPSKSPAAGVEAAEKSSSGSPSAGNWERGEAPRSIPSVSVAVQAVDDSRAGFPTSRSSSAQVSLCSRAVNTEVTMMNKARPVGWLAQTSVDAASNTEWSFRAQSSHLQESNGHLCICDWKTDTHRPEHPSKQTGKNSASSCCQNVLQRAAEAELQLLAIHYEMCYQHCLKVYELALEENTYFGRCEEKNELYSSLLLVLDELDNNYSSMRTEINMGIPLNELPPLSVELKFSPISSFYMPSKFFGKSLFSDDLSGEGKADLEEPKQQEKGISATMEKSQADGDHPGDSASPGTWEEPPKDQALEREVKTVGSGNQHSSVQDDGPKPSVPEDPGENSLLKTSTCSSVNPSGVFVSPYALNLTSFTKLVKRLQERHPEFSRDEIVEAVQEVRRINKGVLSGLAISSIEEKTSAILRRSMCCSQQEKH
uniref:RNA binding motif protein 44 n=1 Tax=Ficedula albicollis TaxID=59894 RepID=A0A803VWJ6_FICAL